jgi:hypothetical protein
VLLSYQGTVVMALPAGRAIVSQTLLQTCAEGTAASALKAAAWQTPLLGLDVKAEGLVKETPKND